MIRFGKKELKIKQCFELKCAIEVTNNRSLRISLINIKIYENKDILVKSKQKPSRASSNTNLYSTKPESFFVEYLF